MTKVSPAKDAPSTRSPVRTSAASAVSAMSSVCATVKKPLKTPLTRKTPATTHWFEYPTASSPRLVSETPTRAMAMSRLRVIRRSSIGETTAPTMIPPMSAPPSVVKTSTPPKTTEATTAPPTWISSCPKASTPEIRTSWSGRFVAYCRSAAARGTGSGRCGTFSRVAKNASVYSPIPTTLTSSAARPHPFAVGSSPPLSAIASGAPPRVMTARPIMAAVRAPATSRARLCSSVVMTAVSDHSGTSHAV